MKIFRGKSVYQDICNGPIFCYERKRINVSVRRAEDRTAECERFAHARLQAAMEIQELHAQAAERVGVENARVFEVQQMLLEDPEFVAGVESFIRNRGVNLEYAIRLQNEETEKKFASYGDAYLLERIRDLQDVSDRVLKILGDDGKEQDVFQNFGLQSLTEPSIIVADDLLPSETVTLPREMVSGLVMRKGSLQSHAAIFARSMGIPAVVSVGEELDYSYHGKYAVLDGFTGEIVVEPFAGVREELRLKKEASDSRKQELRNLIGQDNETKDGRKIKLLANAGTMEDVERALACDAGGIGLLRSEILYLGRDDAPDEEAQFIFYRDVLQKMKGREVIVRTLDAGADKELSYLGLVREENPALGMRGIRIGLTRPELLKTQLRALYRAGVHGKLAIMYPMITSVTEVKRLKVMEAEIKWELEKEGIPYAGDVLTGIMIETPAAALLSEELAQEVDFFSVGTNDLAQYTLALDRQNENLAEFDDLKYKAVMVLIRTACESAHKAGIPIGICGELASDEQFTEEFLRMGMDELSVSPEMILSLRQHIRNLTIKK